jgi:hypothetical protein
MFVLYSKDKRHSQDNQDKEVVQMKYRQKKKSRRGPGYFCCLVSEDKKAKCRTIKTKNKYG